MKEPIPRAYVSALLLHAERHLNQRGWDQPHFMATLELIKRDKLALVPLQLDIPNPAGYFIEYLGKRHLDDPEIGQALAQDVGDRFYGFAFICEAWQRETTEPERPQEWAGRSFADIPGSKEVRMINAIDIHTRVYDIHRLRGQKAYDITTKEGITMTGRVYQGLLNMTLGVVRQLPSHAHLLPDLETYFIHSVEESLDAEQIRRSHDSR